MTTAPAQPARVGGIEVRSIDYVPLDERHGKLWHLGPLWFMSNAQIATLAVGLISITTGGNLIWSLLSIVAGALVGTFFMAFHSAQGPQLRLPQMIQSRPQFGYVGALLIWLFVYVQYAGFNVFNSILAGEALNTTVHGSAKLWFVVVTAAALVVALVGYDLIHRFERYLAYAFIVIFGVFTIGRWPPCTSRPGRCACRTSTGRRSSRSSASWPVTRSAGRRTSRTTRVTCRPTSRSAVRSNGPTGVRRSAPSG